MAVNSVNSFMDSRPMCYVRGCDEMVSARGMCHKHYSNWHRTGHPLGITGQQEKKQKVQEEASQIVMEFEPIMVGPISGLPAAGLIVKYRVERDVSRSELTDRIDEIRNDPESNWRKRQPKLGQLAVIRDHSYLSLLERGKRTPSRTFIVDVLTPALDLTDIERDELLAASGWWPKSSEYIDALVLAHQEGRLKTIDREVPQEVQ
jgi:hypothetical protein